MSNVRRVAPDSMPRSGARRASLGFWLVALLIVVGGGALRLLASWGDFWLDEIWSWAFFATPAKSYWQIATQMPHDNNQILNTWVIYSFPLDAHWTLYRIPAVLAGVGTVIFAGLWGLKRSFCEGFTALSLTSLSFVFIQFSSEARGYAYLLFFTMLCIWLMQRIAVAPNAGMEWQFGLAACFGILGHFLFAGAYAGFGCWSLVSVLSSRRTWFARARSLINLHTLPFLMFAGLAYFYRGRLVSGGGDRQPLLGVIIHTGSLIVGGPDTDDLSLMCCCSAILVSLLGLILFVRRREGFAVFVIASTIALVLMIWIARFDTIYIRHFLIQILCCILLISHMLAEAWKSGVAGRGIYGVAMIAMIVGNGIHTQQLLKFGRGGYEAAVNYINTNTKLPQVTLGSDHDFRNGMVLEYYYRRLKNPNPFAYFPMGQWPTAPEWIITHSFDQPPNNPLSVFVDGAGNKYQLVRIFRYSGLSGWNWMLYHREDLNQPRVEELSSDSTGWRRRRTTERSPSSD